MNKDIKLSIIVPVYNVERYLNQCIDSILKIKLVDFEIILVDDGSTDKSGTICDKLRNTNIDTIKVIHKKNGGLSSARNAGIKIAIGKYLMFVDSDDMINNFDLKILDTDEDIIQYKMIYYYEKNNKYVKLKDLNNDVATYYDALKENIKNGTLSISACDKIVKRELIINNNILFEEGLLSEDVDWSLRLYLSAKSIKITNEEIYIYRQQRVGSISTSININNIASCIYIINKWINYNYQNEMIKTMYYNYIAYWYILTITLCNKKNSTVEQRIELKKFRQIVNYNINYKVNLFYKIYKIFGLNISTMILKVYMFLKNKGLIKI